jgi:DNA phosphorothioation-dependent restriction protein DptH
LQNNLQKYPNLNFSKWNIPDLNFNQIKLLVDEIKSTNFKIEEGTKVLHTEGINISKVKIKFSTIPPPKDISELKYFRIILMAVDGGAGEEISVVRKLKNTNSNRPYREATIELNPNQIEEGSYFFKVMAEDENGIFLNAEDDFKDLSIQKEWIEAKEKDSNFLKSNLNYKLTCDSEDFDYVIDKETERPENQRKDKLNNVLQAYFRYRIEKFKNDHELDIPIPSETSNIWLHDKKIGHTSNFHINYSEKHNYQIIISSKLRYIEDKFLFHSNSLGYVQAQLNNYSSATGFESCNFIESELTSLIPNSILKQREEIFDLIRFSNQSQNGIFETANIFKFYNKIRRYVSRYTEWTSDLKSQISNNELNPEEKGKLQHFLTELQILDIAKIKTKLPDGQPVEALLLSPLHPLRLSWTMQLIEVFNHWESKTIAYGGYKESWPHSLENLFDGGLSPRNSPLVLVEPNSFKNYHYSGELQYGWVFI